jgi:hypothetical protein
MGKTLPYNLTNLDDWGFSIKEKRRKEVSFSVHDFLLYPTPPHKTVYQKPVLLKSRPLFFSSFFFYWTSHSRMQTGSNAGGFSIKEKRRKEVSLSVHDFFFYPKPQHKTA